MHSPLVLLLTSLHWREHRGSLNCCLHRILTNNPERSQRGEGGPMRKHPLSFWVYWIIVIAMVGFTGEGAATGRIISAQPAPDSGNSMPDQASSNPIVPPDTVLAEA